MWRRRELSGAVGFIDSEARGGRQRLGEGPCSTGEDGGWLFTEVEREEWGRSGMRNGRGADGVTHGVTAEEGTRLGVTSRRVAMHIVSRGKPSVDRWAPVISGSEREDLTCGLLCKNLIISIFQIHSNLIRFKIDLPELEQLEIKYGCEYFELRNNVPYCNFSRFGMNFELKLS
jgi:hypothetical protein